MSKKSSTIGALSSDLFFSEIFKTLSLVDRVSYLSANRKSYAHIPENDRKDFEQELSELLLQCFDPTTNTLNLTSAINLSQPPLNQAGKVIPSPADKLAEFWRACVEAKRWDLAESLTGEAFTKALSSIQNVPDQNDSKFSLKNIKISAGLETPFMPKSLANLDGLENFNCRWNKHFCRT